MNPKIITIVGVIVVLGGMTFLANYSNDTVTTNVKPEVLVEEVTPDWASDEDAVKAAQDVIRKKELEAELAELNSDFLNFSKEFNEEKARYAEEKKRIEKELGTFWRDPANVKALIRQTFPEDAAKAIAIAHCESGLRPNAYNPDNNNGSTDGGLWQINSVHDSRLQELGLDKWDPEDATKFARMLYDERGGWQDWVCYTKRMHVAYLR